jgi:DNA-binding MarR family transcriptional regulator
LKELYDWKEPDPSFRAFLLFHRTGQYVLRYSDTHFYSAMGFTTPTFITLKGLIINGGTATHTDMAYWTNTQLHNITGLVRRMVKAGLVTTERDLKDRRIIYIQITELGREKYKEASRVAKASYLQIMKGIDADQALELEKLLNILIDNAQSDPKK